MWPSHVDFHNWIQGAPQKTVITKSRITSEVLFWSWPNFIHIMIMLCAQHPPISKFLATKLGFVLALEDVLQSTVSFVAVCDNQHRVACPGAWRVLDSTWSTERGRQGHPVVRTGWRHPSHLKRITGMATAAFPWPTDQPQVWPRVVAAFTELELPRFLSVGVPEGHGVWRQSTDHSCPEGSHRSTHKGDPEAGKRNENFALRIQVCLQRQEAHLEHNLKRQ